MTQDKLLVLLIILFSLIGIIFFAISPYFNIISFHFQGLSMLKEEELESVTENYYQKNIFTINKKNIISELRKIPYVKSAVVSRNLPGELVINIEERKPAGCINNNDNYLIFSADGYIIEKGSSSDTAEVPLLSGMGYFLNGRKISFSPVLNEIVQALDNLDEEILSRMSIVEMDGGNITADIDRAKIIFGNEREIKRKFKIFESILIEMDNKHESFEYINLSIPEKPVVNFTY